MITLMPTMDGLHQHIAADPRSKPTVVRISNKKELSAAPTTTSTTANKNSSVVSIVYRSNSNKRERPQSVDVSSLRKRERHQSVERQTSSSLSNDSKQERPQSVDLSSTSKREQHQSVERQPSSSLSNGSKRARPKSVDISSTSTREQHQFIERRPSSSLSNSSKRERHQSVDTRERNHQSLERRTTGDEPRVLKRRVKQIRRSKSADGRRKKDYSLHDSIPKSKDDLDPGAFTVVGRPNNPWVHENLKRNKSEPNLRRDITERVNEEHIEESFEEKLSKSQSTPNLREPLVPKEESKPPLVRKRSSHNIYIKSHSTNTETSTETTESTRTQQSEHLTNNTTERNISTVQVGKSTKPNKSRTESTDTSVHTDTSVLDKQKEVLAQAYQFQTSCEELLADIGNVPVIKTIPRSNKDTVKEENISETYEHVQHTSREESYVEENSEKVRTRRRIVVRNITSNLSEDIHDQGIEILKDFIRQLIYEYNIDNIVSIKRYTDSSEVEFNSDLSEEEIMYRKSLNQQGLGLERHSSMPEITRDEFLERRDNNEQGMQRNNSLTNLSQDTKKRIIKTKVSSRLLQGTASTSRKQKSKIPYVAPSKRADPQWTDRPLKNVDSGYTTQTFVKYYDPEKPRDVIHSDNVVVDESERIEWSLSSDGRVDYRNRNPSSESVEKTQIIYDKNNNYQPKPAGYSSSESVEYINSLPNQEPAKVKSNIEYLPTKTGISTTEDEDDVDPTRMKTAFFTHNRSQDDGGVSYEPFTKFSNQGSIFSSVSTTADAHDAKTFKYVYTIDAELSYREYNKLMNIISLLQEQKKKWEDEVSELRDKLEKTGKEKMQLAHNNHILRQSLEAANRAIKEINGKVQELKQTLVPLREDNTVLREENEELKITIETVKKEKITMVNDVQDYKKMKIVYEEKLSYKDAEIEDYKKSMHEKFRRLEEAYRNYRDDMEHKHEGMSNEVEELRASNELLKRELESLRKDNVDLKEEIEDLHRKNEVLELELRKQKSVDDQLVSATKETQLLSANAQELEKVYMVEIEKSTQEIERTRKEIDRYKEDTRELEGENDQLKFDLENLENRIRDLESTNDMKESARKFENEQKEIMKNEVDEMKKQLVDLGALKQEKIMLTEEKNRYKDQFEVLQNQIMEYEKIKRDSFINQHENQRLKSELERSKLEIQGMEDSRRDHNNDAAENQKLKAELQHLRQQLSLLEDKQKYIASPYNDEIKTELENIRNQMKDLADRNQDRKVELYTDELKGELESLRSQIKDLDSINRQPLPPTPPAQQQTNTIVRESNNTFTMSEKEKISEKIIYIQDGNGNLREVKPGEDPTANQRKAVVDEGPVSVVEERQVQSAAPIGDDKPNSKSTQSKSFVLKSSDITKREHEKSNERKADDEGWLPKEILRSDSATKPDTDGRTERIGQRIEDVEEKERKLKQKQIEDRIRRKREQRTDWQLRTPDINKLKRASMDDLEDEENYTNETSRGRSRTRSRSAGRRARSADPKRNLSTERGATTLERSGSLRHPRRERGRSPQRRNRDYIDHSKKVENKTEKVEIEHHVTKQQKYAINVTVDNRKTSSDRQKEINRLMHGKQRQQPVVHDGELSPERRRRVKSGERILSKERKRVDNRYEDSSSEHDEKQPRRRHSKPRDQSRDNEYDASADMLKEAMRSRQEQAMTNKISKNLKADKTDHNRHHQPQQQQHQNHQQQQHQNQQQQQSRQVHQHHQQQHSTDGYSSRTSGRQYNTLPLDKKQPAPVKPKRMFDTVDRGYQTDSPKIARAKKIEEERMKASHSQTYLNKGNTFYESMPMDQRVAKGNQQQQQQTIQTMRSNQSLNLTLKPTANKQQQRTDDQLYAKVDKQTKYSSSEKQRTTSNSQKQLNEEEILQIQRMEKARQKLLQKQNATKENEENVSSEKSTVTIKSQTSVKKGVITRDGIPIQRRNDQKDDQKNNFITEQEADAMFNQERALKQASSGVTQDKPIKHHNSYVVNKSTSDHVRSSTWNHQHKDGRRNHSKTDDEWERANTMPRNLNAHQSSKTDRQHRSSDMLTRDNVEKHRSYRDTKFHDETQRRHHKPSNSQDESKRLSTMSNDSLGGFSQITFTTVNESTHGQRYDDYATQLDDDVETKFKQKRQNGVGTEKRREYFDESEILKKAKFIPKGHSKFHCEKCRELNMRSKTGEPIRFCWERYYPISETTPRASLQSLQHAK